MNITIYATKITEECFNWCKEQNFIHQRNLEIYDLSFLVIALISLAVHMAVYYQIDYLKEQGMSPEMQEKIFDASYFLAYIMIIFYIIYIVFFRT